MPVPLLTGAALAAVLLYQRSKGRTARQLVREAQTPCDQSICPPSYRIHVDRPVHTTLRNDALPRATLKTTYQAVDAQYRREAYEHPGVRLVAHGVR